MSDRGQVTVDAAGDTLTVKLGGSWTLEGGLPPLDAIRQALGRETVRPVRFDAAELDDWDSALVTFLGAVQLQKFGAEIYVADLVAIAMVREMGCVMTGIIMAGRTGSGFAAQLGTMKVTQEIDAFATLGISPMDFLVLPRILALV